MKRKLATNGRLLDQLRSEKAPPKTNSSWVLQLSPDVRRELEAIREAFLSGELLGWSKIALYRRLKSELGIKISSAVFRRFLSAEPASAS